MGKFVSFFLFIVAIPLMGFAQEQTESTDSRSKKPLVVVNEIAWMGTPVEGVEQNQWWRYEWLELYNPTDQAVSVKGWAVELSRDGLDASIPLQGTILAKGYFLVTSSDKIRDFDVHYGSLSGKFANSGQKIALKDVSGAVEEEVDARGGWFGGDNFSKQTMERRDPLQGGNDSKNWGTSKNPGGTPKAQNSIVGEDPVAESSTGQDPKTAEAKEDRFQSSSNAFDIFGPIFFRALALALGSAAAILFLKRRLARVEESQGKGQF